MSDALKLSKDWKKATKKLNDPTDPESKVLKVSSDLSAGQDRCFRQSDGQEIPCPEPYPP